MTNAEARFNKSLRPRKPEGSLGRTAQDIHLDSHTAPELWCPRMSVHWHIRDKLRPMPKHGSTSFTSTETRRLVKTDSPAGTATSTLTQLLNDYVEDAVDRRQNWQEQKCYGSMVRTVVSAAVASSVPRSSVFSLSRCCSEQSQLLEDMVCWRLLMMMMMMSWCLMSSDVSWHITVVQVVFGFKLSCHVQSGVARVRSGLQTALSHYMCGVQVLFVIPNSSHLVKDLISRPLR